MTALAPEASTTRYRYTALADLDALLARYVVMTPEQRTVVALWIVHTHCVRVFEQTPYLFISSPEMRCGKSRLLELLELLVHKGWQTGMPSEATLFRSISKDHPTLLLDEVDAIFNPRTADRYEGLRAILNMGHRRGATVSRCINFGADVEKFDVFGAKALAGIGTLPGTLADRSIPIRLQRKTRDEHVERFRARDVRALAAPMHDRLAAWATTHADALAAARPELPEELSDRMQDGCEPLLAIAEGLGEGEVARSSLVALLTESEARADSTDSMRLNLLRDLRSVFASRGNVNMQTKEVTAALVLLGEYGDWGNYYGRGSIQDRDLASLLKHYDIHSTSVWSPSAASSAKGYRYDDFVDPWTRYLTTETEPQP